MPQHPSPPSSEAFSRTESPAPEVTIALPGVSEVIPGPNAFALQAARMERHRLDGNAFYQQELQKRTVSPPAESHPAMRERSNSVPLTGLLHPGFQRDESRDSQVTTMSTFINAGKTPPLKLVPSPSMTQGDGAPTRRGYIEERNEYNAHVRSGSQVERTPVYVFTPKQADEFDTPKTATKQVFKKDAAQPVKSPKKSVLDLFRKSTRSNSSSPLTSPATTATTVPSTEVPMKVPPKAKAMLGSPPKPPAARSPSKRKTFFSRKNANLPDLNMTKLSSARSGPTSKSSVSDHPLTPSTINSNQGRTPTAGNFAAAGTVGSDQDKAPPAEKSRVTSTLSEQSAKQNTTPLNKRAISRTQSLKYIGGVPPPTPPSKDTPPDEKSKQKSSSKSVEAILAQQAKTPSKAGDSIGVISASGRLSPTKYGNYARKETPRLVTKPSMYSMHASVVPEMVEAGEFEEMKGRIDGLGLEGFTLPDENNYNASPEFVYSPSVYNDDFEARPVSVIRTPRHYNRYSVDNLPTVVEHPFRSNPVSLHHANGSSSTSGTIPVIFRPNDIYYHIPSFRNSRDETVQSDGELLSVHDGNVFDGSQDYASSRLSVQSSDVRQSSNGTLFAIPIDETNRPSEPMSPPTYNNPSAMPSPLQYLPSTVYVSPTSKPRPLARQVTSNDIRGRSTEYLERERSPSPSRSANILDTAPVLLAPGSDSLSKRQNAAQRMEIRIERLIAAVDGGADDSDDEVDPTKQPPTAINSISKDKIDQVLEMLNTMATRNNDVAAIRDEFKANNARLDERLAAIESLQRDSPPAPISNNMRRERNPELPPTPSRVPTMIAHDFYRQRSPTSETYPNPSAMHVSHALQIPMINPPMPLPAMPMHMRTSQTSPLSPPSTHAGSNSEPSPTDQESQTVVRLEQTNMQLMNMVQDLREKMNEMEIRMRNREQNQS